MGRAPRPRKGGPGPVVPPSIPAIAITRATMGEQGESGAILGPAGGGGRFAIGTAGGGAECDWPYMVDTVDWPNAGTLLLS